MFQFIKNIAGVGLGTVFSQLIPFVGLILLPSLYSSDQFGNYGIQLALVTIISVVVSLRLEKAISTAVTKSRQKSAFNSVVLVVLSTSVTLYLGLAITATFIESLEPAIAIIGGSLAIMAAQQTFFSTTGKFKKLVMSRAIYASCFTAFQITIGLYWADWRVLLFAHLIGASVAVFAFPRTLHFSFRQFQYWYPITLRFVRREKNFVIYSLPADLISAVSTNLPLFAIDKLYGGSAAGFFTYFTRMFGAPLAIMGTAILDVFRRDANIEINESGNCSQSFMRTLVVLTVASALAAAFMMVGWKALEKLVLGESWLEYSYFANVLVFLFLVRTVVSPLSYTVYLMRAQAYDLAYQLTNLTFFAMLFYSQIEIALFINLYVFGSITLYIFYLFLNWRISQHAK